MLNLGIRQIRAVNDLTASRPAGYAFLLSGSVMIAAPLLDVLGLPRWLAILLVAASSLAYLVGIMAMYRHSREESR